MKPLLILATILLLSAGNLTAQRTTRKGLRTKPVESAKSAASADTVRAVNSGDILLSGYDKPLRSNTESMFAVNNTGQSVSGLRLRIEYMDMSGRQLHSRDVDINCDIPAGATRQLNFRSWDRQHSFVYHRSQRPKRADYSPYDIRCTIIHYIISTDE